MKANKEGFKSGREGICAVIIYKKKVLLIKRHWIPFLIKEPGAWSFLLGGKKKGEKYLETAYREIKEESGLTKKDLKLVSKPILVKIRESARPQFWWYNKFYIFESKTDRIDLSLENSRHRWETYENVKKSIDYTNIFVDKDKVERIIGRALNAK